MHDTILIALLILHTVDGREVAINPKQVTSLTTPRPGTDGGLFVKDAQCLVNLTDGKYVAVVETCNEIRALLEAAK